MIVTPIISAYIILLTVSILLQIFLSRMENKWPGLIIPVVWFCIAVAITGYRVYEWSLGAAYGNAATNVFGLIGTTVVSFFINNIPTVIFLLIYFAFRERKRRKKALEKMNIQDL
ncbi:MAG TPA: hypothetical protein VIM13_13590 [Clostridia bacterium]